jgi:hypothetical protein
MPMQSNMDLTKKEWKVNRGKKIANQWSSEGSRLGKPGGKMGRNPLPNWADSTPKSFGSIGVFRHFTEKTFLSPIQSLKLTGNPCPISPE